MTTSPFASGEEVSMQSFRALIGWLPNEQEAAQFLLGRNPLPTDDVAALQQIIAECRAAVASRPAFTPTNPIVDTGDDPMLRAVKERPEVQAAFAGLTWFPATVNLREVLAFQKIINTEGLESRLATARTSKEELFELCLPENQPLPPTGAIIDLDGKGMTVSALNPNLRIIGNRVSEAQVNTAPGAPSMKVMALTLFVNMGNSYLQVVRYNDRYFIRDGYHRAVGLLRENIDVVPCIVIEARNFEQVVVSGQQHLFLPYEVLYSSHPPRLTDFWDDTASRTVTRLATRKVIRIRGDEFLVQG